MRRFAIVAALALAPVAAAAQTPPAVAAAPDPARLAAATRLLDALMPSASRAQMMDGMMTPMLANMRDGMMRSPQLAQTLASDPAVKAAFDRFLEAQSRESRDLVRTSLPVLFDAMARAYARRFDTAQLGEMERFFRTPAGVAYMQGSMAIMSDPDVAAAQRDMMATAMTRVQAASAAFATELAAIKQDEKK